MRKFHITLIPLVMVFALLAPAMRAEDSSPVRRITAQTADGLEFSAWIDSVTFDTGRSVIVRYKVRNRSSSPVYLVRRDVPEIANDAGTILIVVPSPGDPKYEKFDFTFTEIRRNKSVMGQFTIPASILEGADEWPIRISFGYVTNIYRFDDRGLPGSDWPLNELLASRINTLGIGELSIKRK